MKHIVFTVINDLTHDQRMIKTCRTLTANGFKITLIGRRLPESIPITDEEFSQARMECFFHKGKLFYLEYNIRLFFFLLPMKFDIICGVDLDTLLPAYLVGILRRKKLVYDAHEYFTEVEEVTNRKLVKSIWKMVERIAIPNADALYTVNYSLARIFEKEYGRKFMVIKNVPLLQPIQEKNSNSNYIIYQGALNVGRGLLELVDIMKDIDVDLLICGHGYLRKDLENRIDEGGVGNKVKLMGAVPPEELNTITRSALFGINVLENKGLNHYYSLANKFFDYIHAEVPQITANFPEYQEINNKYEVAILVDFEIDAIKSAIFKLINEENIRGKLINNCRQAKREYNWQNQESSLIEIYSELG